MRTRRALLALALSLSCVAAATAQDEAEDVGRAINFELARVAARNPMVRARASDELRVYAGKPAGADHLRAKLEDVLPLLADALPVVRWNAAVIVALLGNEAQATGAYDVLRADAQSDDYAIRLGLVEAASQIGPTPEVIALLEGLAQNDADDEVRSVAKEALWDIERAPPTDDEPDDDWGFDPAEFFGVANDDAEESDDEGIRAPLLTGQQAADRIASEVARFPELDAMLAVSQLTSWRRDLDFDGERRPVAEFIAPGVPRLVEFIRRDPAPPGLYLRIAARVLAVAGDDAFDALVVALEDERPYTRDAAAFGLLWSITTRDGRLDEESRYRDAAAALVFSLTDEQPAVRAHAAVALGRAGLSAYARDLEFALRDPDTRVSLAAAQALLALEDGHRDAAAQAARDLIREAADSDDELAAARAMEAAANAGDSSYEARAAALLTSDMPGIAFIAGHYLRAEGGSDGRAALRDARDDARPWVAAAAGARPLAHENAGPSDLVGRVARGEGWTYYSPIDAEIPLPGAALTYHGPVDGTATTDELGRFHVADLPPGRYNVAVTADGHLPDAFVAVVAGAAEDDDEHVRRPTVVRLHRHY